LGEKRLKKIVKITSIFDNFRIFGVDSTHNELRDQLTSAQRNIVGTNIKKHHKYKISTYVLWKQ
jgi:hypothetical protein